MLRFSNDLKRSKFLKAWSSGRLFVWVSFPNKLQELVYNFIHPLKHKIFVVFIDWFIDCYEKWKLFTMNYCQLLDR
jgi:hypothetical protein